MTFLSRLTGPMPEGSSLVNETLRTHGIGGLHGPARPTIAGHLIDPLWTAGLDEGTDVDEEGPSTPEDLGRLVGLTAYLKQHPDIWERPPSEPEPEPESGGSADANASKSVDKGRLDLSRLLEILPTVSTIPDPDPSGLSTSGALRAAGGVAGDLAVAGGKTLAKETAAGLLHGDDAEAISMRALDSMSGFSWTYMQELIRQHDVRGDIAKLLEQGCLYLVDKVVQVTNVGKYLEEVGPYIRTLKRLKDFVEMIPQPIRVLLGYGIGWCIRQFSQRCMGGLITEAHINLLMIEGGDVMRVLGNAIDFLSMLGGDTTSTIYKTVWAAANKLGYTDAKSAAELLYGTGEGGPDEPGDPKENKIVDVKNDFFWLDVDSPKLERWRSENGERERGGLELESSFGLHLFGNTMGVDKQVIHVPYSGGWSANFTDISILSHEVGLSGIFTGGPLGITKLRMDDEGVQFLHLYVANLTFGEDVVVLPKLRMTYRKGEKDLRFTGNGVVNMLDHRFEGRGNLHLDTSGTFQSGRIELGSPDTFSMFDDKLQLRDPKAWASFKRGEQPDIGVQGDLFLNVSDKLQMASKGTTVRYTDGGFVGSVDQLSIDVPVGDNGKVRFELNEAKIDKDGFQAEDAKLLYAHASKAHRDELPGSEDEAPASGENLSDSAVSDILPGFDASWMDHTGLDLLVIEAGATGIKLNSSGLSVDGLYKRLARLKAKVLGVGAEFDGEKGAGSLKGEYRYEPTLPGLDFEFPIVPGLNGNLGLDAELALFAGIQGDLARGTPESEDGPVPWSVGGNVYLGADADIDFVAGLSAGVPWLGGVEADLFANAGTHLKGDFGLHGRLLVDEKENKVSVDKQPENKPKATFNFEADLHAALGARIRAKFFYFFSKTLWQYRFREWKLGQYKVHGEITGKPDGGYKVDIEKAGFGSNGIPRHPQVEKRVVPVWQSIEKLEAQGDGLEDELKLHRLVQDVVDPARNMEPERQTKLLERISKLNRTNKDVAKVKADILGMSEERTNPDGLGVSYIMAPEEWKTYSTTHSTFSDISKRRDIKPVDETVTRYHEATDKASRLRILDEMIDAVDAYEKKWFKNRKKMPRRLRRDAQDEKDRLLDMAD